MVAAQTEFLFLENLPPPVLSSKPRTWDGIVVEQRHHSPDENELDVPPVPDHSITLAALAAVLGVGCTSPSQGTQSNTPQTSGQVSNTPSNTVTKTQTRKTTKHTAQRAFGTFKRSIETGEAQPFVDMVSDDVTFEIGRENGWYGVQRGKDAVVEHTRWRWNDLQLRGQVTQERVTVSENTIIYEFRIDGTVKGNPFKKNLAIFFDVRGDKISRFREYAG